MAEIFLVEERQELLSKLSTTLQSAQFSVRELPCLVSMLTSCLERQPDLLVVRGPFAGLEIRDMLELRRELPTIAHTPVLVVAPDPQNKLTCFRLGCDDFVVQPVEETELFFRICSLLRRRGEVQSLDGGIRGSLSDIGIVDLVQMFVAARRDGRLVVESGAEHGTLFFTEGHVGDAEWGTASGEDGFLALLKAGVSGGTFQFIPEQFGERAVRIEKRTDHLLLGFANMMDEGKS